MMELSRAYRETAPYAFEALDRRHAEAIASGRSLIDLGVGDPRDETPAFIRQALMDAIEPVSSYPRAAGLPELRAAIAAWAERRFGVTLDADREILPTLGSKEVVFSLAQAVLRPEDGRDLVLVTEPGYPVPERGARFAGAEIRRLPLTRERGFLPDLEALADEDLSRTALLWLNYPNNPTGAVAPRSFLEAAAGLARERGFLLASDEAYCELWFGDEAPGSILQVGDLTNVVAAHTLSKRSSMTGYRSGFVAGDPALIGAMQRLRPAVGVTPQTFVQRASVAAWNDEEHVVRARDRYARKRERFLQLFERKGIVVAGSEGTFYLWVEVPDGRGSAAWADELLAHDVVVAPGAFFGPEGEGYVRLAMVPSIEDCDRAIAILDAMLPDRTVAV
jgi:acetylornithine aminotransferase